MRSRVQVSLPLQRSDFYHSFFCSGERLCVTHPLNPPPVRGTYYFSQRRFISITLFFVAGGETVCYLSPKPPLTFALPPSHLGIVCKQSLPSVWRRFCKGGLYFSFPANSASRHPSRWRFFIRVGRRITAKAFFYCFYDCSHIYISPKSPFSLSHSMYHILPPHKNLLFFCFYLFIIIFVT